MWWDFPLYLFKNDTLYPWQASLFCIELWMGRSSQNSVTSTISKGRFTHSMRCPCHSPAMPCHRGFRMFFFPIWLTQCGHVWFTLAVPCPYCAHAMLWPCRSSQALGTARPSRDGLWATCPCSASGCQAEFHEDCYQKHTNPPHGNPYLWL